ncbi:MAG: phospholipase D-like domain-containing protein [Acetobacteraceae bacterium]
MKSTDRIAARAPRTRPRAGVWPVLLLALGLSGCVTVPPVDADIARAISKTDTQGRLNLLMKQDERISHRPFTAGNRVELLRNGPATFAAMERAIESATRRIDMESYTFDSTEGAQFAALLLARRAAGVEVNLVYDAWGSMGTPAALFRKLRAGGVHVLEFNPLGPNARVPVDLNRRDHRKLLVVDAAVAITGGVNISRVYERGPPPPGSTATADTLPWRDTDVRITGPAVAQFERLFMQTWHAQRGPAIGLPPASPGWIRGHALVQAIDGTPAKEQPAIYRTLVVAIALAQRSVHLTTGFFAPPPELRHVLERAARRGVDVRIVVPDHSTSSMAIAAGRADYGDLLEAGVHILERHGVVLHAKTTVIDGDYSIVGSSNLDWRSVVFNDEIDAVVIDRPFGRQMEALFQQDEIHSVPIRLQAWETRPLGERLEEWTARLIEPLL